MTIRQIYDIKIIEELHEKIFGYEFPLESFYKKTKKFDVLVFIYEEKGENIGYSIVVDKEEQKTLYAWYGGILSEYQSKGITKKFFDMIVDVAREKSYNSITVATSNLRPHMLTFAINSGFDICDIKKRDTGEGKKLTFTKEQLIDNELKNIDGESNKEVAFRMNNFFNELINNNFCENVAVISHGAAIKFYLSQICTINNDFELIYNNKILKINSPSGLKIKIEENKISDIVQIY